MLSILSEVYRYKPTKRDVYRTLSGIHATVRTGTNGMIFLLVYRGIQTNQVWLHFFPSGDSSQSD